MPLSFVLVAAVISAAGDIREHPGGKELPHDKYIRVVSERTLRSSRSTSRRRMVSTSRRRCASRRAMGRSRRWSCFMGTRAAGGWSSSPAGRVATTGGPVWERFLQEGYVVIVADYRRIDFRDIGKPISAGQATYVDDGIAVFDHVSAPAVCRQVAHRRLRREPRRQPGAPPDRAAAGPRRHPRCSGPDELPRHLDPGRRGRARSPRIASGGWLPTPSRPGRISSRSDARS